MNAARGFAERHCPAGPLVEVRSRPTRESNHDGSSVCEILASHGEHTHLLVGVAYDLPFGDESAMALVLDPRALGNDAEQVLREAHRVVAVEGIIVVAAEGIPQDSQGPPRIEEGPIEGYLKRFFPFVNLIDREIDEGESSSVILLVASRRKQRLPHAVARVEHHRPQRELEHEGDGPKELDRLRREILRARAGEREALRRGDELVETVAALEDELEVTLETLHATRQHLLERRDISEQLAEQLADATMRIEGLEDDLGRVRSEYLAQTSELAVAVEEATEALRGERRVRQRFDEVHVKTRELMRRETTLRGLLLRLVETRIEGQHDVDHDLDS